VTGVTPGCRRGQVPLTECLKDTVARVLPVLERLVGAALRADQKLLVAAHGNSIRALVKYLDASATTTSSG